MGDCADDILGTLFQDENKATLMKFMLPSVAILIPGGQKLGQTDIQD